MIDNFDNNRPFFTIFYNFGPVGHGHFWILTQGVTFDTWHKKAKRQKYKRQRPKREFNIVTSGQFCTLAMFLSTPRGELLWSTPPGEFSSMTLGKFEELFPVQDRKTKKNPKREFNMVTSGQFCTLLSTPPDEISSIPPGKF